MAEQIILSPVLQVVLEKLASPALEIFGSMWDLKDNLEKLRLTLPMVQALLDDAESQQATNAAVKVWLSKLKDVAYDAENLLLDFSECAASCSTFNMMLNSTDADKVKEMIRMLEMITDEGLRLNLNKCTALRREWDRRETSSFVIESEVYGRDEDKERIIEMLLSCQEGNYQGEGVFSIPIVGMGGIGKTTVAQLAYNDQKVTQHFDVRIWVFVSDHFDVKNIMTTVIESLTKDKCEYSNMDALHSTVWRLLQKKRYLIVLDDVWTEDQNDWDQLRPLFRGGMVGSRILITTRSVKVVLLMDSPTFPYYLKGLSKDACWSVFLRRAFRQGEEGKNPLLIPIGQQIVKKCGGVA